MIKISQKLIWSSLAVIIIIGALFWVWSGKKVSDEITVGVISGLSGDYAVVGENFVKGVTLAQEQWNIANPKRQIKIISENDGFDSKKGLSAYKKLTEVDKVDGLINATTVTMDVIYSDVIKTGLPVAQGFEQGIEPKNDNIVQLWPGNVPAEAELGKYIKEKGFKKVAVFIDNSSSFFTQALKGFEKGYGSPVSEFKVSSDASVLRTSVLKVTEIKPEAIVFIVQPSEGIILIKEFNKIAKNKYQYVFDANLQTGFETYAKGLGDMNILNGSIVFSVPNIYRQEFVSAYKNKFGTDPAIGSETGYNAFVLISSAYNSNRDAWVKNMKAASFRGADGQVVFDENGVRIPELKIGIIENGKLPN